MCVDCGCVSRIESRGSFWLLRSVSRHIFHPLQLDVVSCHGFVYLLKGEWCISFSLRRRCIDAIEVEGIHGPREAHGDHIRSFILSRSYIMLRSSKLLRSYGLGRPFIADTFVGQGVACV